MGGRELCFSEVQDDSVPSAAASNPGLQLAAHRAVGTGRGLGALLCCYGLRQPALPNPPLPP